MTRIAQHPIEIYECIVGLARPNPVIDGLALCFHVGGPETGKRIAFNGIQCAAICLEAKRMSAIDDLAVPLNDLLDADGLRRIPNQWRNDDVGVALQDDEVVRRRFARARRDRDVPKLVPTKSCRITIAEASPRSARRLPMCPAETGAGAARRFGKRWFMFGVNPNPSVTESPSATIALARRDALTSTPVTK